MNAMYKRLLVLLAALVLLVSVIGLTAIAAQTEATDEPVCYEHGDVNSDGNVDGQDAIYALFHSFGDLFGDQFPVEQNCDLDGDGDEDGDDAVYLLFASFGDLFGDQFPLKGTVHNYYDPIWTWDTTAAEPTAQVSLKCACGEPHAITEKVVISTGAEVKPTCLAAGSKVFTARVTYNGTDFENTVTVTVPASGDGHSIVGEPTCENGVKCQNCDYEVSALGHSYAANGEKVEGCKHTKLYKCAVCQNQIEGTSESDVYYTHSYTAELKEEATCTKAGLKLLACSVCGDTEEEILPVNPEFHVWGEGVTEGTVTTYTCACGQTKTAVQMDENGVSADDLKENEVELEGGTTVSLDEKTADQLDTTKTIVISVEEVALDEIENMGDEEKAQVGDNTVYDFSMTYSDGTPISEFEGFVTVALPYELQEGDDVNSIDVWYIADDGSVECVKGVYSNGYVTFQTDHFSYYTVTRLTPAQRCAVYGHVNVTTTKAATCTEDGYTKVFCQRCGAVESDTVAKMLGHSYVENADKSVAATCDAPGKKVSVCEHCQVEQVEDLKQLTHDWEKTEAVDPDCTSNGYDKYVCKLCRDEKIDNEQEAKGHNYQVAEDGWVWSDDYSKATVTLTCANENTHTKVLAAVVTKETKDSVCVGGTTTYTATASFNKVSYTDTATSTQTDVGHTPDSKWEASDSQHYHLCTVCGDKVGAASHDWERTVTQTATCDKAGSATDKCSVCDMEKEVVLPATGEHSFVNGVCSVCGYAETSCDHNNSHITEIDLSQYGACDGYLVVQSCDCGQIGGINDGSYTCDFEGTQDYDETSYRFRNVCKTCGLVVEYSEYRMLDQEACTSQWVMSYLITKGDTVIVDVEKANSSSPHPIVVEKDPVNLADYGMCGGTLVQQTCYCGERSYWNSNGLNCSWVYDEESGQSVCSVCGTERKGASKIGKEGCLVVEEYCTAYWRNGQEVFSFTECYMYQEHSYKYSYVLKGESCEDGVTTTGTCTDCGYSSTSSYSGHFTHMVESYDLSAYGFCGDTIRVHRCACGENSSYDFTDDSCEWEVLAGDENSWTYRCRICGVERNIKSTALEDADPCRTTYLRTYTYSKDGQTLCAIEQTEYNYIHRYVYEMTLNAGAVDCSGGWKYTATCLACGESYTGSSSGCYSRVAAREVVSTEDMCGQLEKLTYRCACGRVSHTEAQWTGDESCEFNEDGYDETMDVWVYTCSNCGSYYMDKWTVVPVEGTTCEYLETDTTTYWNKAGQELVTSERSNTYYSHKWTYTYTLLGETCDDGWTCSLTCAACGEVSDNSDSILYGCETNPVSWEVVYDSNAICGPVYLGHNVCACGAEESYNWSFSCRGSWINGYYTCDTCGLQYTNRYDYERIPRTCREKVHMEYTFLLSGEKVATVEKSWERTNHVWVYSFQLLGESCEDGYTVTRNCVYCDYGEIWQDTYYSHDSWRIEYYDLPEESCGGYIYIYGCACGREYWIEYNPYNCSMSTKNWTETDENGAVRHYWKFECRTCGLVAEEEWYYTPGADACNKVVHQDYTWKLGDWELHLTGNYLTTEHDYETLSLVLMSGATDCENGVSVTRRCAECGYEYTGSTYSHEIMAAESIDLSQYGSVCGGTVDLMKCACGRYQSYEFSEDLQCDLDEKSTSHWIENVLDDYCHTTEGGWGNWSYSYIYTCAVTDPACSMQIRMSRYWLNENCTAVQYETWQLGYDAKTGTCLREITVATGESRGYHPYETAAVNETLEDGTSASGTKFTCPDCGSYYTELSYYNSEGLQVKFVREAVNLLNNGENQKLTEIWEYVYFNGYQYTSLQRDEYVHADGSTYWYQYAYTYDFTNGCYRTEVYTTSDGGYSTNNGENAHHDSWSWEQIKDSTCTQFGEHIERWTCVVCGKVTEEHIYEDEPIAHSWTWDYDKQIYVCYYCDLESVNGASGEIVMEDLTADYTDGNYVIGYWNRSNGSFNPYVSLILYDAAEGEEDELVLTGIEFTYLTVANDGICGLQFSQEAVAAAAADAIKTAGYTGSYAVRISFVPSTGDTTLDYAITFETQTAE